ncbi:isopentenyl phosphate kinase [Halegenticoccus tardaugens]|uniref:isopentenyl phosphate kinase n=1 Tax=Halegenticoccus tardaugens TaxID=2071624 RepID=UPI00100AEF53|nr:isopentenyl phosphate kinase [Halegenticoccus tardaugens]
MTTVLKLGGSLVTEKDRRETVDEAALGAAIDAIAEAEVGAKTAVGTGDDDDLVLVHGGGSFGHYHAEKYGVSADAGTRDAAAATAIHAAMKRLNDAVVDGLHDRGVPALPVHPFSAGVRGADGGLTFPLEPVETMLGEGFVPVLHGDCVTQVEKGVTILSGDELVVRLADGLTADRVGLCSTVSGVLDGEGEVIPEIRAFADAADALGGSDATDVTGGMAAKVRALLELDAPSYVFGPEGLEAFLAGGSPGTRVERNAR